jgi:hypothetical protein
MTAGTYNANQVMLGAVPKEGPKSVAWNVDFTAQTLYQFDLTAIQFNTGLSMIQTLYVDNSKSSVPLFVTCSTTNQTIGVPPQSYAYIPLVLTNKVAVTLQSTSGQVIPVQALNIAMNAAVWSVNGAPVVTNGLLQVQDSILESAVSSGKFNVTPLQLTGDGVTYAPVMLDTRMVSVNIAATSTTTIFSAGAGVGWAVKSIDILLSPDAVQGTAGENAVNLFENATKIASTGIFVAPAAAPTFATAVGPLQLLRKENINLTSKVAGSTFGASLNGTLTAGAVTINVTYAISPFIGG